LGSCPILLEGSRLFLGARRTRRKLFGGHHGRQGR
jgi:hypothetical protein